MPFDVTTLGQKACCSKPSCLSSTYDGFDCEECGSNCNGCKWPEYRRQQGLEI